MFYNVRTHEVNTHSTLKVITGMGNQMGSALVVQGNIVCNVASNSLGAPKPDYFAPPGCGSMGVYSVGAYANHHDLVCVSGMSSCTALIASRGNAAACNFTEYIAIHAGGAASALVDYFTVIVRSWIATTTGGPFWVVGANGDDNEGQRAVWVNFVKRLFKINETQMLFYYPSGNIALRKDGMVGELPY